VRGKKKGDVGTNLRGGRVRAGQAIAEDIIHTKDQARSEKKKKTVEKRGGKVKGQSDLRGSATSATRSGISPDHACWGQQKGKMRKEKEEL